MKAKSLLNEAAEVIDDRGHSYGDIDQMFSRIASIASTVLNIQINAYQIAMIMHCVKLARMSSLHDQSDNYLDGINYLAFANQLKFGHVEREAENDGAAEMAQKLRPLTYTEEALRAAATQG